MSGCTANRLGKCTVCGVYIDTEEAFRIADTDYFLCPECTQDNTRPSREVILPVFEFSGCTGYIGNNTITGAAGTSLKIQDSIALDVVENFLSGKSVRNNPGIDIDIDGRAELSKNQIEGYRWAYEVSADELHASDNRAALVREDKEMGTKGFDFKAKKDIKIKRNDADGFDTGYTAESTHGSIEANDNRAWSKEQPQQRWWRQFWVQVMAGTIAGIIALVAGTFIWQAISPSAAQEGTQTTQSQSNK